MRQVSTMATSWVFALVDGDDHFDVAELVFEEAATLGAQLRRPAFEESIVDGTVQPSMLRSVCDVGFGVSGFSFGCDVSSLTMPFRARRRPEVSLGVAELRGVHDRVGGFLGRADEVMRLDESTLPLNSGRGRPRPGPCEAWPIRRELRPRGR